MSKYRDDVNAAIKEFEHVLKNNYDSFKNAKLVPVFIVDKREKFSWAGILTPDDEKATKQLPVDDKCRAYARFPKVYFKMFYDEAHYGGYLYFYDSHVHVSLLDVKQNFIE
jgi:hypothetical protein